MKRVFTAEQLDARREYARQWRESHKDHNREYMANWRAKNPDKVANIWRRRALKKPHYHLKTHYKISEARARFLYEQMQSAACQICGGPDVVFDHDHATGEFRGFLCKRCNNVLGMAGDDVAILEAAIKYLRKE